MSELLPSSPDDLGCFYPSHNLEGCRHGSPSAESDSRLANTACFDHRSSYKDVLCLSEGEAAEGMHSLPRRHDQLAFAARRTARAIST